MTCSSTRLGLLIFMNQIPVHITPPKPFKTYPQLVALMQQRGILVEDVARAERKLSQVGYYRLSGFWYPCRTIDFDVRGRARRCPQTLLPIRNNDVLPGTTFNAVFDMYLFDKKLRQAMLDAVERVEVFLRSIIAHELGYHSPLAYQDSGFVNPKWCQDYCDKRGQIRNTWNEWQSRVEKLIRESREDCIVWHRKRKKALPLWVIIETWDFGTMSRYFEILAGKYQNKICERLDNCKSKELAGWLKELNTLRNRCAHHTRIWNQNTGNSLSVTSVPRLVALGLNEHALSKLYGQICVLWHLVTLIGPSSNWISMVADIVDSKPSLPNCGFTAMGFPDDTGFPRQLFYV